MSREAEAAQVYRDIASSQPESGSVQEQDALARIDARRREERLRIEATQEDRERARRRYWTREVRKPW